MSAIPLVARADFNASFKSESMDWGVGIRTSSGNPTSEWVNAQNNGDFAVGLMNGYFRYHGDALGGAATYENQVHGGTQGTAGNTDSVILDDARQWQVYTDWTLPMSFRFVAEYVRNKKVNYGTRLAGGHTHKETDHDAFARLRQSEECYGLVALLFLRE